MIAFDGSFAGFRDAARAALADHVPPERAHFDDANTAQRGLDLLAPEGRGRASTAGPQPTVPRGFVELGETVALHRDPRRWALLYRVLHRLTHGEPRLLSRATDPDIRTLARMGSAVRRDIHKLHAFVRFRKIEHEGRPLWVSFYEPDHRVLAAAVPHFVDRLGDDAFLIATPEGAAHWDGAQLSFSAGAPPELFAAAAADETEQGIEQLFRAYYASVFNPARANLRATLNEMPRRFWKRIPEAQELPSLLAQAALRTGEMLEVDVVAAQVPPDATLPLLEEAASRCTACPIHHAATQTVFGRGPLDARIVLVGEQPGDEEDRRGEPFVGPAGRLLRTLLAEAGLDPAHLYLTNAVKHFKWEPRGKRRLHMKPAYSEVRACRPWLEAELAQLSPDVVVCLGVTAAQSLLGPGFRLAQGKDRVFPQPWARALVTTYHPSAILRLEGQAATDARAQLVADLRRAKDLSALPPASAASPLDPPSLHAATPPCPP